MDLNAETPYVRRAVQLATSSNLKTHRHGCVIYDNESGAIVAEGYNYTWNALANPQLHSMHAELMALALYRPLRRIYPNCSMVVVRIGGGSKNASKSPACLKYSKPCQLCTSAILDARINRVYYSTHPSYCSDTSDTYSSSGSVASSKSDKSRKSQNIHLL